MSADNPIAYTADRLFDGEQVREQHAVLVAGPTVVDVLPLSGLADSVSRYHYEGCTLLPGLIDTHVHFMRWQGPLYLAAGVTTVRDTGNDLDWILARKAECLELACPRITCLGPILDGGSGYHPLVTRGCADRASAIQAVKETGAQNVDGIKLYVGIEADWLPDLVQASHDAGLKISKHCQRDGALVAIDAGIDEFYHLDGLLWDIWPDAPPGWLELWGHPDFAVALGRRKELVQRIVDSGVTTTPTLAYWDSQWRVLSVDPVDAEPASRVPAAILATQCNAERDEASSAQWRRALDQAVEFLGMIRESGGTILAGTDVPCGGIAAGQSLWRELELFVESGMMPVQALRSATSDAADFLEAPHLGRLRAGAAADLIAVRGDCIRALPVEPELEFVMRGGVPFSRTDLLAKAEALVDTVDADPWGRQFRLHARRPAV